MKMKYLSVLLCSALVFAFYGCEKTSSNTYTDAASGSCGTVATAAKPSVSFKISNLLSNGNVLEGNVVKFAVTTQNAVSYSWDFGDGNTSTEKLPTAFYYTVCSTTKNISLTVKNSKGETATYSQPFVVQCCRGYSNHTPVTEPTHL